MFYLEVQGSTCNRVLAILGDSGSLDFVLKYSYHSDNYLESPSTGQEANAEEAAAEEVRQNAAASSSSAASADEAFLGRLGDMGVFENRRVLAISRYCR